MQHEMPKGPIQTLATGLFFAGIGLYLVLDVFLDVTPWVGLSLMAAGVLLSISLLLVQWRAKQG